METIPQLDSGLEDTQENENEEILKLHAENLELRTLLKNLSKKIDQAIEEPGKSKRKKPRRASLNTRKQNAIEERNKHKYVTSEQIEKNEGIEHLEKIVKKLENTNAKLRRNVDQDVIEIIHPELKNEFEKLQKQLRNLFKAECAGFKMKAEIQENHKTIESLMRKYDICRPARTRPFNPFALPYQKLMKRLSQVENEKAESINSLVQTQFALEKELETLHNIAAKKKKNLELHENHLKEHKGEMKTPTKDAILYNRNAFSPEIDYKTNRFLTNRVISADNLHRKARIRRASNPPLKPIVHESNILRKTGNFQELITENKSNPEMLIKTSNFGDPLRASEVFKYINLSPTDFELTFNFTLEATKAKNKIV